MTAGYPGDVDDVEFCYLTTIGRRSGRPHEVEIWFAAEGGRLFLIGGHTETDWLRNLRANPRVTVRIGQSFATGTARVVEDPVERRRVGELLRSKYDQSLNPEDVVENGRSWAFGATAVAVEEFE